MGKDGLKIAFQSLENSFEKRKKDIKTKKTILKWKIRLAESRKNQKIWLWVFCKCLIMNQKRD